MSDAKKMLKELSYTHLVPKDEQGRELVAVVRCKDCKHMSISKNYAPMRFCDVWCDYNGMGDEGYCNYGERKDNELPCND